MGLRVRRKGFLVAGIVFAAMALALAVPIRRYAMTNRRHRTEMREQAEKAEEALDALRRGDWRAASEYVNRVRPVFDYKPVGSDFLTGSFLVAGLASALCLVRAFRGPRKFDFLNLSLEDAAARNTEGGGAIYSMESWLTGLGSTGMGAMTAYVGYALFSESIRLHGSSYWWKGHGEILGVVGGAVPLAFVLAGASGILYGFYCVGRRRRVSVDPAAKLVVCESGWIIMRRKHTYNSQGVTLVVHPTFSRAIRFFAAVVRRPGSVEQARQFSLSVLQPDFCMRLLTAANEEACLKKAKKLLEQTGLDFVISDHVL